MGVLSISGYGRSAAALGLRGVGIEPVEGVAWVGGALGDGCSLGWGWGSKVSDIETVQRPDQRSSGCGAPSVTGTGARPRRLRRGPGRWELDVVGSGVER